MAFPTILVNNSTGSDTSASGAGPSTAVSGTGASLNATTTVDLSADSPDLSGIATDGSEALWVDTTSGRMFGRITAVDDGADTVTVHAAFGVTESSRNWGIGGKRATTAPTNGTRLGINVVPADSDGEAWTIEVEYTGTAYDTINLGFDGCGGELAPFTLKGSGASRPELLHDQYVTVPIIFGRSSNDSYVKVDFLDFHGNRSDGNYTSLINNGSKAGIWHIKNCELRGSGGLVTTSYCSAISQELNRWFPHGTTILENCHIHHLGGSGISRQGGGMQPVFRVFGCKIHDMGVSGLMIRRSFGSVDNCEIYNCGAVGIDMAGSASYPGIQSITNTVIHDCTGDGISVTDRFAWCGTIRNCSITDNGGYGLNSIGQLNGEDYNLFNGNTSGSANNHTIGGNSITSVPQYTDSANGDFTRTGTNRKAVGGPPEIGLLTGTRTNFAVIGSLQEEGTGGGGGGSHGFGSNFSLE